jgi:hypothetical protein
MARRKRMTDAELHRAISDAVFHKAVEESRGAPPILTGGEVRDLIARWKRKKTVRIPTITRKDTHP